MATTAPQPTKGRATTPARRLPLLTMLIVGGSVLVVSYFVYQARQGSVSAQPLATLATQDVHALVWSPTEVNTVFFGHHDGLLVSWDGGTTWQQTSLTGADAMSLAVSPADAQRMYAAGHEVFLRSDDGGGTWAPVAGPLQGQDIHGFAASPDDASRLYAFVMGQGLLTSADGGTTWAALPGQQPPDVTALMAGPGQALFVGTAQGEVDATFDGGTTWRRSSLGAGTQVTALAYDGATDQVYAAAAMADAPRGMIYRQTTGAPSWEALPFTGNGIPLALSVNPQDGKTLLVVTNSREVYRSRDGGTTWAN